MHMPSAPRLLIVGAIVLAFALRAGGQEARSDLAAQLQARVRRDDLSGAVLVARDGRPIFAEGFGLANREHDVPNTPRTKFRIGSISKPITALLLLLLVQ